MKIKAVHKKLLKPPKSVFAYWILSYLSVLCIPLIVSLMVTGSAFHMMETEVSEAYLGSLSQTQYFLDSKFAAVKEIGVQLSNDTLVNILKGVNWDYTRSEHELFQQLQKNLSSLKSTDGFIGGIYLYHQAGDMILSDRDVYYAKDFDFANSENFQLDKDVFYDMLHKKYNGQFLYLDGKGGDGTLHTQVLYALSLPVLPTETVKLNLFVSVDWAQLSKLMKERNWAEGNYISFRAKEGYLIRVPYGELSGGLPQVDFADASGTWDIRLDGKPYKLSAVDSTVMKGSYFSVIAQDKYRHKADRLLQILYLCVGGCIIMGGILIYVHAKRNYRPIRQILDLLDGRKQRILQEAEDSTPPTGEYYMIEENIRHLIDVNRTQDAELVNTRQRFRDETIARLIEGTLHPGNGLAKELGKYGITFPSEKFFVAVICVTDFKNLFFEETDDDDDEAFRTVIFIIRNVAEDMLGMHFSVAQAELRGDLTVLLCASFEKESTAKECALHDLSQVQSFIEENFGVTFTFVIGGLRQGFDKLSESYYECQEIIEYNELFNASAVFYGDIAESRGKAVSGEFSAGLERKMLNCLRAGNFAAAREHLHNLFLYCLSSVSPSCLRHRIYGLVGIFLNGLEELSLQEPELFVKNKIDHEELYQNQSPAQIEASMNRILKDLESADEQRQEYRQTEQQQEMLSYVEERLFDPNLTITMLADHFGFSVSYASKLFKSSNDIGFLNYVHSRRVEEAQHMLTDGSRTLREIAEQVGYNNDIALIRLFKKYTGITPGKYRELKARKNDAPPSEKG